MTIIRDGQAAVSLVEVLIAMAILSMLALPMGMFLVEYNRGSSQVGDYYQILNLLEQRLEMALSVNFQDLPAGKHNDLIIEQEGKVLLDLRPATVSNAQVHFSINIETVSLDFAALKDSVSGQVQRAKVEEGMKKVEISATWGDKARHSLNLIAYRANL